VVLFSIIVQGLTLPALLARVYGGEPATPEAKEAAAAGSPL
jgi:hypothetical protein